MPRPTKITPEAAERIVGAVMVGAPLELAATAGGVTDRTVRRWLERGRREKKGPYAAFAKSITEAQVRLLTRHLAVVDKAGLQGDWRASAWKLAHVFPAQFGGPNQLEVSGKGGKPIQVQGETKVSGSPLQPLEVLKILQEVGALDDVLAKDAKKEEPGGDSSSGPVPARN